jgi:hypothetical protein
MHHQILRVIITVGIVAFCGGCSGNDPAQSDDNHAQSGQNNGTACDNSTLPLPADCSGSYTCYFHDPTLGTVEGWLVREGSKCLWQFDNDHGQDLSDPSVVIDGRNFTFLESGRTLVECHPKDAD